MLTRSPILILDEPTASLDITSTSEIIRTVEQLRGQRTVILATHDRRAVAVADHIVVAEEDHAVQEGTQKDMELMSAFYRQLVCEEATKV